jgi:phage terminase large subunit-like protein
MQATKEQVMMAAELERRRTEEKIRYLRYFPKQMEVFETPKRVRGVLGGNRAGKTVLGSTMTVIALLGERLRKYVQVAWPKEQLAAYERFLADRPFEVKNAWCATINWDVHLDVTQPEVLRWIPKREIKKIHNRQRGVIDYIDFVNGSRLTFKSYDSGRAAFQGKSLDWLWLDEEPELEIWEECQMRLVDRMGTAVLTMTPLMGLSWVYDAIYLNVNNDPEVFCINITWDDTPYLDDNEKKRLLSTMSEDEILARTKGMFVAPGTSPFRTSNLLKRRDDIRNLPARRYKFENGAWHETPDGELVVFKPPAKGRWYSIGCDVAEGLASRDNSASCVVDATTAEQVAELCVSADPDTFSSMVNALGLWYNNAEVVVERNNTGQAVLLALDSKHYYPCLFKYDGDDRLGWPENSRTRPIAVGLGQEMIRECPDIINSVPLIEECLTFVRGDDGKPKAIGKGKRGGKKDDRVFAWLLSLIGREKIGPPFKIITPDDQREHKYAKWEANAWVSTESMEDFWPGQ